MSRPLRSTPITGASALLRAGPPADSRIGTPRLAISVARRSPSRHPPPIAVSDSQQVPVSEPAFLRSMQKPQNRLAPPLCRTPPGP